MGNRKRYTAEEKIKILREVLEEGKSISKTTEFTLVFSFCKRMTGQVKGKSSFVT
uniref:Transposase n=1 Tax=uncultured bacterium contig00062 TaxID=1181545 RepID=A0A806KKD4_9BACT|nr:hypothetical protein [uncultured bacterium contig00062]